MTTYTGTPPTAERLLSTLVKLYADQNGVKIDFTIVTGKDSTKNEKMDSIAS